MQYIAVRLIFLLTSWVNEKGLKRGIKNLGVFRLQFVFLRKQVNLIYFYWYQILIGNREWVAGHPPVPPWFPTTFTILTSLLRTLRLDRVFCKIDYFKQKHTTR